MPGFRWQTLAVSSQCNLNVSLGFCLPIRGESSLSKKKGSSKAGCAMERQRRSSAQVKQGREREMEQGRLAASPCFLAIYSFLAFISYQLSHPFFYGNLMVAANKNRQKNTIQCKQNQKPKKKPKTASCLGRSKQLNNSKLRKSSIKANSGYTQQQL